MSAYVNRNASKKDLKAVKQYLENMDPKKKAESVYAVKDYAPWHGDGKSQTLSPKGIAFQTKSMYTSGEPQGYKTVVTLKGKSDAYVTYESPTWNANIGTIIIDEMIKAINLKV
ncbi:hypothetical protein DEU56DRAFT_903291 [Suillus clintonianus]|uniref:uncharacterized protein n=1 Tax=Suillus clintonianus TaxID=1904413 RepID=UPI001B869F8D|nr:uncharacterized protein DEU56DRAFT_903291 [Suillus clintonianus]KAG2127102.1 hypothetical protein DEU56DRAFT_903291 [Suillus clintonianus]